jgi:hypothetical protein
MSTNFRFTEPTNIKDSELRSYLNALIRDLQSFDNAIFSQESGVLFNTAKKHPFRHISDAYTMGYKDTVVLADASAGSYAVSLPDSLATKGCFLFIKKVDTNIATVVSVEGSGPEFPFVCSAAGSDLTVFSDGENFWVF